MKPKKRREAWRLRTWLLSPVSSLPPLLKSSPFLLDLSLLSSSIVAAESPFLTPLPPPPHGTHSQPQYSQGEGIDLYRFQVEEGSCLFGSFRLGVSSVSHWPWDLHFGTQCFCEFCYSSDLHPHLKMSFRSMVRDLRGSFGNISKQSFEVRIHHRGKSLGSSSDMQEETVMVQDSRWASLPPELLRDVMKRLEEDENSWPSRKDVVACASVCKTWRDMCKDIVRTPEFCSKLTFPVSLKQPGPRDGMIQCFIKRDKSKRTYHLYLCLTSAVSDENGKFLLAAKRSRRTSHTDYTISMDSKNICRSSSGYIGKLRSNFLGTKFIIYDAQPPYNAGRLCSQEWTSRRFSSRKVSPKVGTGIYPIAQVNYELNVLGTRGPRRMLCTMHSIPASAVEPDGVVPGQPNELLPRLFEESFRSSTGTYFSKYSIADNSMDLSSSRFSEFSGGMLDHGDDADKESPLVLRNKVPRWHEQLQCWCLNFRGRVTVASVKNFQLIASVVPSQPAPPSQMQPQSSVQASSSSSHDTVILQFGKVAKDMFTMDYRYPLSAFQAFAICLTSFDTKLACE